MTGTDLTPERLAAVARDGAPVAVGEAARTRMADAHAVLLRVVDAGEAVYGVTTGLGSRVGQREPDASGSAVSLRTLRGRANAVGPPLSREATRAAMAVCLNGLCTGGSGADPAVADALAAALNAGVHPTVPRIGSVGAADLCMMAHVGLGLVGEGECERDGRRLPAAQALEEAGLAPLALGPRDGLAVASNASVSAGVAALALLDAEAALTGMQAAAALSLEGFRANLSPLDPRVVAARPAPGQAWAADGLLALVAGGRLTRPGGARRLQDPLSLRCVSSIHGSLRVALDLLAAALAPELNGSGDNPVVLVEDEEVRSTGNFHVPALVLACDAVAIALAQVAATSAARQARLLAPALSDLPAGLSPPDAPAGHSGMAPLSKTAHALVLEIRHRATPLAALGTTVSDGVEDDATGATQAALRLFEQIERLRLLVALELVVAAQAVDLAGADDLGAGTAVVHRRVRDVVAPLHGDRPLGADVDRLAAALPGPDGLLARLEVPA